MGAGSMAPLAPGQLGDPEVAGPAHLLDVGRLEGTGNDHRSRAGLRGTGRDAADNGRAGRDQDRQLRPHDIDDDHDGLMGRALPTVRRRATGIFGVLLFLGLTEGTRRKQREERESEQQCST